MKNQLFLGDALEILPTLSSGSVDLICSDLPYGTTQNKWDSVLPLDLMWELFYKVLKPGGQIVLTAAQPFTSLLISSNIKNFKYDVIWEKTISSGQLNVKRQPLRCHETILVFGNKSKATTYNEQKEQGGTPYKITRKKVKNEGCYGDQKPSIKVSDGSRHARSVIKIPNPRIKGGHPTQKPVLLMEYLIKVYSNRGDTVLDPTMGVGSTGVAALKLDRNFIGIEINPNYFNKANIRIRDVK
jgi:site-specific DNA-methyltransferase (adenine-specific)